MGLDRRRASVREGTKSRGNILLQNTIFRYLFGIVTVASAFALRIWLIPLTGTGAPYVLFFAAVLVTSLSAGVRPAIVALLLSMLLGAYTFVVGAGHSIGQAFFQSLLFAVDGIVVIYLTSRIKKGHQVTQDVNRQLRGANEEITRSMARTREIIELSPDAFFQADRSARFTEVNPAACRMLGYERDELVGKTLFDIVPDQDALRLEAVRADLLTPGRVDRAAWTLIRKDGTFVPVEVSSNILPEGRWQAFVRDISERKRFEDQRQVFVTFLENSSDFIGIADQNGKPLYVNPAGRRMVGLPADYPVENTQILEYYPSDQRAFASDVIVRSMVEQGRWHGETYFRHWQTEKAIPVSDEHFMIRDSETGRVLGMGTITRDISDARRTAEEREQLLAREQLAHRQAETANEQLRESEERFRLTIDEAPIGMALVALDGRFVRVNRALCDIVGYSSDELTGLTFQAITHPDDRDADLALLDQLARGEIPRYHLVKRYVRKDGTIVDTQLHRSILRNREGAPLYFIAQIEDITDRKRAETALHDSERRLALALDSAQMGMWDLDLLTDTSVRSLRHDQIFGYSAAAPTWGAAVFMTHVVPEDRDLAKHAFETAFVSDNFDMECRIRWADESIHWISAKGRVYRNPKGDPVRMMGTVLDVTEQKRAEQRLKESEAKFSGIVSISADAIISIDEEQRITIFNDGAEQIFGYSKAEAIGTPLGNLMPERFREAHRQHVEGFASGPVTARPMGERLTTIVGLRKNGEEFPVEAAISNLQVGDKTILTVAMRDTSERKRFEKEQQLLAEAGAVLGTSLDYEQTLANVARLMVQSVADWSAVDVMDKKGLSNLARLVNQSVADWSAVDVMDEKGRLRRLKVASADSDQTTLCAVLEQMPPDRDLPHLMRAVAESKRSIVVEHVTSEYIESLAQGPEHLQALVATGVTSFVAVPLLIRGQALGALFLGSSTPFRAFGQRDLRWAEALADRAAMAIENGRLYSAAVHASQLRDQVLGVVAHDLRNPLSAILMQTSALKRQGPEFERRSEKPVEVIQRAATRMNRLIQDLLDIALMEAGQLTIERARLSAGGLIAEAVDMQRPLASSSSLELRVEVGPDVTEVWGDRDRLLQVFENLIGNAIKFTQAGGRITAGATSRDDEVVFRVADTGCGIPSENLPHVFDRFWQATRRGGLGAGLGLPITKGIVETHGGRIWVESTAGTGSTFFFTIPRALQVRDGLSGDRRPGRAA